jgi:hypothetical protein
MKGLFDPKVLDDSGYIAYQISDQTHHLKRSLQNTPSWHRVAATRAHPNQKGSDHAKPGFAQRFFQLID